MLDGRTLAHFRGLVYRSIMFLPAWEHRRIQNISGPIPHPLALLQQTRPIQHHLDITIA